MPASLMASYFVHLGGALLPHAALLVITLLIRTRRPDAFVPLLVSSLVGLARVLLFFVVGLVTPIVAARHGIATFRSEEYGAANLAIALLGVMIIALEALLLAVGIWRLATRDAHV